MDSDLTTYNSGGSNQWKSEEYVEENQGEEIRLRENVKWNKLNTININGEYVKKSSGRIA